MNMNQIDIYNALREHGPMSTTELTDLFYPDRDPFKRTGRISTIRGRLVQLVKWNMVDSRTEKGSNGRKVSIWYAVREEPE